MGALGLETEVKKMIIELTEDETTKKWAKYVYKKALEVLTGRMARCVMSYLKCSKTQFHRYYAIEPRMEINIQYKLTGIEVYAKMYFDDDTLEWLEKTIKEMIKDRRVSASIRLRALKDILASEVFSISSGVDAILHDHNTSSTENSIKAGGDREEVWSEEGRPNNEGDNKNINGGIQVKGDKP
jgi:hypothetical protein